MKRGRRREGGGERMGGNEMRWGKKEGRRVGEEEGREREWSINGRSVE